MSQNRISGEERELQELIAANRSQISYIEQLRDDDAYYEAQIKKLRDAASRLNEQADRIEQNRRDADKLIEQAHSRVAELKRGVALIRRKRDLRRLEKLTERLNAMGEAGGER